MATREPSLAQVVIPPSVKPSSRLLEMVALVIHGNSGKIIARGLRIREDTVQDHADAILRKLGFNNRTELVVDTFRNAGLLNVTR